MRAYWKAFVILLIIANAVGMAIHVKHDNYTAAIWHTMIIWLLMWVDRN